MTDCIFCKIVEKEISSTNVYEDSKIVAFLDINPVAHGHVIVVPKIHYETLDMIPDPLLAELIKVVKKVSIAQKKGLKNQGFNVIQNSGEAAEQEVPHVHFHVIPRFTGDGKKLVAFSTESYEEGYEPEEKRKIANSIRQAMME